jgi:predicted nuclease with TOPRIM domain
MSNVQSSSINSSLHNELNNQYDNLLKQMEKIRVDYFSRINERLKRVQYMTKICIDKLNSLNEKVSSMENKLLDVQNQYVAGHKLDSDLNILSDIDQLLNNVENNRYDEDLQDNRSLLSE